jgi:hypothetical protein
MEEELWVVGEVLCPSCGYHQDIHVYLLGSEPIQCARCLQMLCVPVDAEDLWSNANKS